MNERKGELEGLSWQQRSGRDNDECHRNGFSQVWRWFWRLIYPEPLVFDASRALNCVAKGERNTVWVVASNGKEMGL